MSKVASLTPKQALAAWAKANGIKPAEFARKTGYTYSYAWSILRGNTEITSDTLGKIMLAFGPDSVRDVIKAMQHLHLGVGSSAEKIDTGEGASLAGNIGA